MRDPETAEFNISQETFTRVRYMNLLTVINFQKEYLWISDERAFGRMLVAKKNV